MLLIWAGAFSSTSAAVVATQLGRGGGGGGSRYDDARLEYERIRKRRKELKRKIDERENAEQAAILANLYELSRLDALEREAEEILILMSA